jgi:hypothetical protein
LISHAINWLQTAVRAVPWPLKHFNCLNTQKFPNNCSKFKCYTTENVCALRILTNEHVINLIKVRKILVRLLINDTFSVTLVTERGMTRWFTNK